MAELEAPNCGVCTVATSTSLTVSPCVYRCSISHSTVEKWASRTVSPKFSFSRCEKACPHSNRALQSWRKKGKKHLQGQLMALVMFCCCDVIRGGSEADRYICLQLGHMITISQLNYCKACFLWGRAGSSQRVNLQRLQERGRFVLVYEEMLQPRRRTAGNLSDFLCRIYSYIRYFCL